MKNWNEIETCLKMSTLEKIYAAFLIERELKESLTHNEVRYFLASQFGCCRTKNQVRKDLELLN